MRAQNIFNLARDLLAFVFILVLSAAYFTPVIDNSSFAQESNYLKKILSPVSKLRARNSRPLRVTTDTLTMTGRITQAMKAKAEPVSASGKTPPTQLITTDPMMMTGRP